MDSCLPSTRIIIVIVIKIGIGIEIEFVEIQAFVERIFHILGTSQISNNPLREGGKGKGGLRGIAAPV